MSSVVSLVSDGAASHAAVGGGRGRHVSGRVCHSVSVRVRARMHTSLGVSRYFNHLDKMRRTDTEQAHCMSLRHTRDAYSLELSYNKRRDWSVLRWGIPRLANVRPSHKAFLLVVFPQQLMAMPVCWNYSVTTTQTVF